MISLYIYHAIRRNLRTILIDLRFPRYNLSAMNFPVQPC